MSWRRGCPTNGFGDETEDRALSGIVGIGKLGSEPPEDLDVSTKACAATMLRCLDHRGPDGSDVWSGRFAALGHCLRVTTPESRHERQPLATADGRYAMVADARIDNRGELLSELAAELHRDLARSAAEDVVPDSALILASYLRWGEACVDRLHGDYAFAIWDGDTRQWFCARDPFGVRSLFYTHRPGELFAFATEIKAILAMPGMPRQLDETRVALFLTAVFDDEAITFYRGVKRLPAGHCMVVRADGFRVWRHFELDPKREIKLGSDEDYAEAYLELFRESVRCRLRATAPVVSTLSGGLDSTSIACTARDLSRASGGPDLNTVSGIFPSFSGRDLRRIDERNYVADVAAAGGVVPHYVEVDTVSPLVDLDRILMLQDEAIMTPNYYLHWALYERAEQIGAGVFLDGLDGDTTVSHGYDYLVDLACGLHPFRLWAEVKALAKNHPRYGMRRLVRELVARPVIDSVTYPMRKILPREQSRPWGDLSLVNPEFAAEIGLADRIHELRGNPPRPDLGSRAIHRSGLLSPMIPHALEVADRGTNYRGLEGRYPFCDRRLAEFCLALPGSQKLRLGMSRYVMRRAMEGILPESVQWRNTKADLSPSLFRGLWHFEAEPVRAAAATQSELAHRFLDMAAFRKSVKDYAEGGNAEAFRLYGVMSLLRWFELNGMDA